MMKAPWGSGRMVRLTNKYCSLVIALILFSLSSIAQTRDQLQQVNALGYNYQTGAYRKLFYIPKDTLSTADSGAIASVAGKLWLKGTTSWRDVGNTFDSTSLSVRIDRKINYVDTSTVLADYRAAINARQPVGNYLTGGSGAVNFTAPIGGGVANTVIANTTVVPGDYVNANLTIGPDGRVTAASNGTGGGSGTDNTNLGAAIKWLNSTTQGIKTVESTTTIVWDSTSTSNRARVDTSAGKIATQPMLALKQDLIGYTPENIGSKSTNTSLGVSNILYPTQNAVKQYVDGQIAAIPGVTIDVSLADGSANAIQNNAVYDALLLKQANLVSGTNIKTINGNSLLGSGNIVISGGSGLPDGDYNDWTLSSSSTVATINTNAITTPKVAALAITNAKINDVAYSKLTSIPDAGADGSTKGDATFAANDFNAFAGLISFDYTNGQKATSGQPGLLLAADWSTFNNKQAALVSGTNIKTVNGTSLLGSGNISIAGGVSDGTYSDVVISSSASVYTIANSAINSLKIQDGAVTNTDLANSTIGFAAPGTSGTSPNWSSSSTALGASATLNFPYAGTTSVVLGGISKTDYDNFNYKQNVFNVKAYGATGDGTTVDRTAIQNAIIAADAAGGGIVYFPNGVYNLGTGVTTSDNTGRNPNSQLYIPVREYNGAGRTHIIFEGESKPNFTVGGLNINFTASLKGVVIKSQVTSATGASVIGSATGVSVPYNFNYFTARNFAVIVPANISGGGPAINGIDGFNLASSIYDNVVVSIDASMLNSANPTHDVFGFRTTGNGGESYSRVSNTYVMGFTNGYIAQEHAILDHAQAFACYSAIGTTHSAYAISIYKSLAAWCKRGISFYGGDQRVQCSLLEFEIREGTGKWFDYDAVIYDPNNYGYGKIVYTLRLADTDLQVDDQFVMTGGSHLNTVALDDDGRGNATSLQAVTDIGNTTTNPIIAASLRLTPESAGAGAVWYNPGAVSNFARTFSYPTTGTNTGLGLTMIPRGTGFTSDIKTSIALFNTDFIADATNYAAMSVVAGGTLNTFNSLSAGSTPVKPFAFQINGSSALTIDTDRTLIVPVMTTGDSDDSIVVRKPDGTLAKIAQSSLGGGGGGVGTLQQVTDLGTVSTHVIQTAGIKYTPEATGETAIIYNPGGVANLSFTYNYPTTGTNVGNAFSLIPRGTGYDASNRALLNLYGTDIIADASNFNALRLITGSTGHIINSMAVGTGTVQPLSLTINSVPALTVATGRNVTIPVMSTGSSGDSVVVRTAAGELRKVAQSSLGGGGGSTQWNNNANGIDYGSGLQNVGINKSLPADLLDIVGNQNARSRVFISNNSTGTSAQAVYGASNGTSLIQFGILGINRPGFLSVATGAGYIYSDATPGIGIAAENGPLVLEGGMSSITITPSVGTALSDLAGTGTRMVVASSTGLLSTQAIPSGSGTDFYTTDGTLTSNRSIAGGSNSLSLGTSGSALSQLNVFTNVTKYDGRIIFKHTNPDGTSNYTISASEQYLALSTGISANRTITMPTATNNAGAYPEGAQIVLILRNSANSFHWSLNAAITDIKTGSTFTQLEWSSTYTFMVIGGTWYLINKY